MSKNNFAEGSVAKNIFRIALPLTVAQIVNVLYNVIDRAFIGHIPDVGRSALTGVGVAFPLITFIIAFTNLCGMGGSPIFSIARGEGDAKKASRIMGNAMSMLIFLSVIITAAGYIFKQPALYLLGASDNTIGYADSYFSIYLAGTLFAMISTGMNIFISAQGFGGIGMLTVLSGALCNIALDALFIFGLDMGVRGAALATIISQLLSALLVLLFLCSKRAVIRLKISDMKPDFKVIKRIISVGLSPFIMSVTTAASQSLCNHVLQSYGGDLYVGIMTVIISIREIMLLAGGGLTQGASPVISYNYGAKEYIRTRKGIKIMVIIDLFCLFIPWVFLMAFPNFFISIFNNDSELLKIGPDCIRLFFFSHFIMAFQSSGQTSFLALGKSRQAIFFSLLRKAILVMPLVIILPKLFGLGVYGVFLAEPISDIIGGISCFSTFMLTVWPTVKPAKNENSIKGSVQIDR